MLIEPEALQFDRFTLDRRRRRLLSGDKPLSVQDKVFDLLEYFVLHAGEELRRDDIIAHVWSGRTVAEGSLSVQLSALRKLLEKAGSTEPLILTLPNQRYRFVGEVSLPPPPPPPEPPKLPEAPDLPKTPEPPRPPVNLSRWITASLTAGALLAVLALILWVNPHSDLMPPGLSLVVLPFENLSTDRTQDNLAENITDDLTNDLSHIPASTVIARESAEAVRGKSLQQTGAELHVRYIIKGAVSSDDAGYHANVKVIEAETGKLAVPGFRIDKPRDRESALRDAIVHSIASRLHLQLDSLESSRSLHDRPDNPSATDLFFQARASIEQDDSPEGFRKAKDLFEKAIAKQDHFADAEAALAWLLLRRVSAFDYPESDSDYAEAKSLIKRALADSPQNAKALSARARELQADHDCPEAEAEARLAQEIEPSSVDSLTVLAACAQFEGRLDDAVAQYNRILQLDPENPGNGPRYLALGSIDLVLGHLKEAAGLLAKALSGKEDEAGPSYALGANEPGRFVQIAAIYLNGDKHEAREKYASYARHWPLRTTWRMAGYFPKTWRPLKGFDDMLQAVHDAGMPNFSDPDDPTGAVADDAACVEGDFAPTPHHLAKVPVIGTSDVRLRSMERSPPLIIDVGRGRADIRGVIAFGRTTTDESPIEFAVREAGESPKSAPLVVLGDGPTGCAAYRAAKLLSTKEAYTNVSWYRGGEEIWFRDIQN